MKILLLGDYSNVHWTLAEGLRRLGHEVTVVSDGDGWKNYPRDIDLRRRSMGRWDTARYLMDVVRLWPSLRGYDVVQLINPVFLDLRGCRIWPFYRFLRRHNGRVFMGAFGMDHYWVKAGLDCRTFRYSDFNLGESERRGGENEEFIRAWLHGEKGEVNRRVAEDCDGIISGLYEYDASYRPHFGDKVRFIPFPINRSCITPARVHSDGAPLRFFIGIQRSRSAYKGTDIMLRALERVAARYPDRCEVVRAESVPFAEYCGLMDGSDVLLDQLYSYTPAMNALLAMAKGMIVVGGGEEENYRILGEDTLRPIVNVQPDEEDVVDRLEEMVRWSDEHVRRMQADSREYIRRYHDHVDVARRYVEFWTDGA
ncbi:MAG: hypothetical protein NC388_10460 [Clostridium sp.]|nr:hypothetical protein [Clostridium sp.]